MFKAFQWVRQHIITLTGLMGGITAVLFSVFGWWLANYSHRAKPEIVITSIGFGGPSIDASVSINPETVSISNETYSVNGLQKSETYSFLISYYNEVVERKNALQSSLDSIHNWRGQYSGFNAELAAEAVRSHPLVRDEAVVRGLIGRVNRNFPVPDLVEHLKYPADACRLNTLTASAEASAKAARVAAAVAKTELEMDVKTSQDASQPLDHEATVKIIADYAKVAAAAAQEAAAADHDAHLPYPPSAGGTQSNANIEAIVNSAGGSQTQITALSSNLLRQPTVVIADYSSCLIPGALLTTHDPKTNEELHTWLLLNNNVTPLVLSYPIWHPEYRRRWIDFVAESILAANAQNLEWLSSRFVEYASAEINSLNRLQTKLHEEIISASYLKMKISIYNTGERPVAIKPAFAVHIVYQDQRQHELNDIIMVAAVEQMTPASGDALAHSSVATIGSSASLAMSSTNSSLNEDAPFQNHASSPYFALGPSAQTPLVLTSTKRLDAKARTLNELLTAGIAQFQLVAERAGGGLIWSARTTFGYDPSTDATDQLQKLAGQNKLDHSWLDDLWDLLPTF
jgi:hypothetical protein